MSYSINTVAEVLYERLKQSLTDFLWEPLDEHIERPTLDRFYRERGLESSSTGISEKINSIKEVVNPKRLPKYETLEEGLQKYERLFLIDCKNKDNSWSWWALGG